MGKKKLKDPQQSPQTDTVSSTSSIFSKLFINAPEQSTTTAAASLFSDSNPFRRKPAQLSDTTNVTQNPNNDVAAVNPESGEEKKLKSKKEKTQSPDSVIEASEKSEKKRKRDSDEGRGKDLNLGAEESLIGKRKRKRDEVEREWEEKNYGRLVGDEDEKEQIETKTVGSKRKTLDNAADMMVSKEGFDDEDKLLRTVFVGNLPLKVKKKTLLKEFKKFGEVESVRIRSVPIQDTKKPRKAAILAKKINDDGDSVHAYVVFKTEESAQASLSHNMTLVEGNHIRVDRACPPRKKLKGESVPLYDNKRTVFVGNLPFDVKDEELYQLFCGISNLESNVEAVRVVRDPHLNVGKGIAYVLFKTKEAAKFVVKKRNLKLRDRQLRLSHAKADSTPSKRPNPSSAQTPSTPSKRPYPSPAQAPGTPAKRFSVASRSPLSSNKMPDRKTTASYQGLRATKSDVPQKTYGGEKPKQRLTKRPSVAARKAKANSVKENGPLKQAGVKRKLDSRTPDSSLHDKKAKKKR